MPHQVDAVVLSHAPVAEGRHAMTLHAPEIAREARPGQFVQLRFDSPYPPLFRRPFSVFRVDRAAGSFAVVYLVRGAFTRGMAELPVGGRVSAVGPLGGAFSDPNSREARTVMVAGGVGAPPLFFHASELVRTGFPAGKITVINGARTASMLIAGDDFVALGVDARTTTDDGSAGARGLVTGELQRVLDAGPVSGVCACGPTPMLRAVADVCAASGTPCQISVETLMPCGMGVCMGCVVKRRDPDSQTGFSYARACHDGPVFDAQELIWD